MPRDDPQNPRYKQIEQMARSLGWDKAESFFANMVDDDEEEMARQLDPSGIMPVWLNQFDEMKNRLLELEKANLELTKRESERPVSNSGTSGIRKN